LISLDFELVWGVRDTKSLASYGRNLIGVRDAIPKMLELFRSHKTCATWATVGFLLFDRKKELLEYLPSLRPSYARPEFDPYPALNEIGEDERTDPYHFGLSLVRRILDYAGMELGSHTFSHYYCLEEGQTLATFRADLEAAVAATRRLTTRPVSLVFPRNQHTSKYLRVAADCGFEGVRTNERSALYRAAAHHQESLLRRYIRLADAYVDISGSNSFVPGNTEDVVTLPSSRFLRPFDSRLAMLNPLKLARIKSAMTEAARLGEYFHLWWHPHNFGWNMAENLAFLDDILRHHVYLRDKYGVKSLTMADAAREFRCPA